MDQARKKRWLTELRLNGFVVLPDFLDRVWVEAAFEQMLPLLEGELERTRKGDSTTARGGNRLAFDVARYAKLLAGPIADDCYMQNPVIEEIVSDYLDGPESWYRGWSQVECVWKGAEFMHWHSDQLPEDTLDPDALNTPVRVTYNIPLVDFGWANGAIEILPSSHTLPRNFVTQPFLDIPNVYPVRLRLDRGDAVLRDGNGLHRGTPNLTDVPRPMLDRTYRRKREGS